jgi:phosphoribosyl 1,2-cyclic phosphodiesterase
MPRLRFASLGSGSQGNGLLAAVGDTHVLLDCGFGLADTVARLARLGVEAGQLSAIVVTHEHEDHIGGVARIAKRFDVPVWLTHGTLRGFEAMFADVRINVVQGYAPFCVGSLHVQPYPVPHDAREPAQYVLSDGVRRLGVLTDTGESTRHIEETLSGCDALVLECNHDPAMLARSSYPPKVRDRISGRLGHLDNAAAAALLAKLDCRRLKHLIAAHLSQQNNTPQLAREALASVLGCSEDWIGVATQEGGFAWRELE